MDEPHPDMQSLVALIADHDRTNGNAPDPEGRVAGFDSSAPLGAGGYRAELMMEGHGTLRKTLNPQQLSELRSLLAAAWRDGFAVGARSRA